MSLPTLCRRGFTNRGTNLLELARGSDIPVFLCPALLRPTYFALHSPTHSQHRKLFQTCSVRRNTNLSSVSAPTTISSSIPAHDSVLLPAQCSGCGALSQTINSEDPGFFTLSRRSVKSYLGINDHSYSRRASESGATEGTLLKTDPEILKSLGLQVPKTSCQDKSPPVCDRCHTLLHHQTGVSIHHPSIKSIQDTIFESPHKYNHVYHIIDAADFPMSFIPGIHRLLHLTAQRSLNRRSKTGRFYHGRKTEVSFIITRSDLLAPLKTHVDSLMPYLVEVLREALGSTGKDVRLGNVRCVSAKRGWWTKELKEDVWNRGGGGWMLGKVNVGKSQLFESIFPKGRRGLVRTGEPEVTKSLVPGNDPELNLEKQWDVEGSNEIEKNEVDWEDHKIPDLAILDPMSLLPPAQSETDYPAMPLVSPLPGTTASPIRVPFGNGKGELIDLPGLSRGDLELFVQDKHRQSLVMKSRIRPEQQSIKPGQSLLLGGFIRITPTTPDLVFLAYSFTPISAHLTSTEKAIGIQTQQRESGVENIANSDTAEKIASAGRFVLKWDVTQKRSGPITARSAAGIKVERLPYQVFSTDILIEGCGWVELVAQVRKKALKSTAVACEAPTSDEETPTENYSNFPEVEVFSPEGRFVASRRPLGAWLLGGERKHISGMKGRPRKSMKGAKKKSKILARMGTT